MQVPTIEELTLSVADLAPEESAPELIAYLFIPGLQPPWLSVGATRKAWNLTWEADRSLRAGLSAEQAQAVVSDLLTRMAQDAVVNLEVAKELAQQHKTAADKKK